MSTYSHSQSRPPDRKRAPLPPAPNQHASQPQANRGYERHETFANQGYQPQAKSTYQGYPHNKSTNQEYPPTKSTNQGYAPTKSTNQGYAPTKSTNQDYAPHTQSNNGTYAPNPRSSNQPNDAHSANRGYPRDYKSNASSRDEPNANAPKSRDVKPDYTPQSHVSKPQGSDPNQKSYSNKGSYPHNQQHTSDNSKSGYNKSYPNSNSSANQRQSGQTSRYDQLDASRLSNPSSHSHQNQTADIKSYQSSETLNKYGNNRSMPQPPVRNKHSFEATKMYNDNAKQSGYSIDKGPQDHKTVPERRDNQSVTRQSTHDRPQYPNQQRMSNSQANLKQGPNAPPRSTHHIPQDVPQEYGSNQNKYADRDSSKYNDRARQNYNQSQPSEHEARPKSSTSTVMYDNRGFVSSTHSLNTIGNGNQAPVAPSRRKSGVSSSVTNLSAVPSAPIEEANVYDTIPDKTIRSGRPESKQTTHRDQQRTSKFEKNTSAKQSAPRNVARHSRPYAPRPVSTGGVNLNPNGASRPISASSVNLHLNAGLAQRSSSLSALNQPGNLATQNKNFSSSNPAINSVSQGQSNLLRARSRMSLVSNMSRAESIASLIALDNPKLLRQASAYARFEDGQAPNDYFPLSVVALVISACSLIGAVVAGLAVYFSISSRQESRMDNKIRAYHDGRTAFMLSIGAIVFALIVYFTIGLIVGLVYSQPHS